MSCLPALLEDLSRQPKYLEKTQKTNREAHSSTLLGLAADSLNLFTDRSIFDNGLKIYACRKASHAFFIYFYFIVQCHFSLSYLIQIP